MNREVLFDTDTVYHYTSKETGLEHILSSFTLRLGLYSETDDPHEYHDRLTSALLDGKRYDEEPYPLMALSEIYAKYLSNTKIACFCRNVPDRKDFHAAYQKSRMWSQYAKGHQGICIALSRESMRQELRKSETSVYSGDMKYFRNRERLRSTHFEEDALLDTDKNEYIRRHIDDHFEEMFLYKHVDYRDEDEYRIVVVDDHPRKIFVGIRHAIVAVILGDRFPKVYEPLVSGVCSQNHIPCMRYAFKDFRSQLSEV